MNDRLVERIREVVDEEACSRDEALQALRIVLTEVLYEERFIYDE